MLSSIAVLFHPYKDAAIATAKQLVVELQQRGIATYLGSAWDSQTLVEGAVGRDLIIVLGGDGTIVQVARETAITGVPTLGVNLGRVGFLAELTPELLPERLPEIIAGHFWIEERFMLQAEWQQSNQRASHQALNEVALARGRTTRAIRVRVFLDEFDYTTHTADGVLVATATGSTAYALAAGGPIIYPQSTDILLTPVAPHLHIGRSLVLPGTMCVTLELSSDREAVLAIDGHMECPFDAGNRVEVRASPHRAHFARLRPPTYFYSVLAERLH
jgi:NAD+ kinase